MTTVYEFRMVQESQKRAKRAGFTLVDGVHEFKLVPRTGMGVRLMALPWQASYETLEEAMAFCDGWYQLERALQRKAGMGAKEVGERMEQHAVLTALKGKGRRKRDGI
jgi:hypothetical protein